jgi:molybdopterin-dependent oxidoreductase alpha subunit
MKKPKSGGGWKAIAYTLRKANEAGWVPFWRAMRSKNTCKTCAVGMGGQKGGMVNEAGSFPEFCKKSLQAVTADLQQGIPESFWKTYSIAQLEKFSPRELEHCGRLVTPVRWRAGQQYYEELDWETALSCISNKLKSTPPKESFWYFSGRSSNEAGFLLQLFARLYGTNNINNCSYYCHQASGVGLNSSLGTGTATIVLEDLEKSDLVFVIGGNPASNHPRLMSSLKTVRRRGGKVVVINPVVELGLVNFRVPSDPRSLLWGTEIASTYIQPHIGGDLALLTGIAKRVVEQGGHDTAFLKEHCQDADRWLESLKSHSWEDLVRKSGVEKAQIDELATIYMASQNAVFSWTMGITHHANGVDNVQAIANLALLRGMVGKPHAGLLPIRGHSNVQGIGSVGVTPKLKDTIFERLQTHYKVQLPTEPGLDTLGCMEGAEAGELKVGLSLGGNLYGSNPDAQFASQSLRELDLMVYLNTTLNTGHAHGLAKETIILPVLARDEEPHSTTQESMFNFVRLSDGGRARHQGPRSEVSVISALARQVLGDAGPIDWKPLEDTGRIREMIAKVVPGFEQLEETNRTKKEFQIKGRTFHTPHFATPTGRAQLHCHDIPELLAHEQQLRLMTVRSEGQFNTVVYEEEDLYRGQDRRDVILVHPEDIEKLGLEEETRVTVTSSTGRMDQILLRGYTDIRPGNALMYYPEANILVPRHADPQSRTPAFKNILISLKAASTSTPSPVGRS